MDLKIGDIFTWGRTFNEEEVMQFAELSGDKGIHHMERDEKGRLMVHGLFTASISTKIGGDLNFIAREMVNDFVRPVFTGDTITCEVEVTNVEQGERYKKIKLKSTYRNQVGKVVINGTIDGIIRN